MQDTSTPLFDFTNVSSAEYVPDDPFGSSACSSNSSSGSIDSGSGGGKDEESTLSRPAKGASAFANMKVRRQSLLQPPEEDNEEEMREEISRSRRTGNCNLSALSLTAIPADVPLVTLTSLCLSENALSRLPEGAFVDGNGANLVVLKLNSNRLVRLPDSLFFLPKLEELHMNQNRLVTLPAAPTAPAGANGRAFLPSLRRVGMEFNQLEEFPTCFFVHCAHLTEVLLGQNENMLNREVPLAPLLASPIHTAWAAGTRMDKVVLRLDNRPRLMQQMQVEAWDAKMPWLDLSLHKIYPDKVLDYLFLGSMRTAQTVNVYHDLDIKYVLTVGRDLEVFIEPGMHHKVLLVDDLPGANISAVFKEAFEFIDKARAEHKGVLIHCFAGLSRSVTVAAAYIMQLRHISRDDAMALIKAARPAAQPNEGFMAALKKAEPELMNGAL